MNKKQFQKYLERDKACPCCGITGDQLIPQHRQNRGMGGSKLRNNPANIIVFCSTGNGLMESNSTFAGLARDYGWKLTAGQDPTKIPVRLWDGWFLLNDNYERTSTEKPDEE